jgi:signal transduction histidine kinase
VTRPKGYTALADFIDHKRRPIVAEWEAFAQSLTPAATGMNPSALRDHADEILTAIIHDMKSQQTEAEQAEKSKGRGTAHRLGAISKIHAALRIENGFKLGQLVAEYRALRASVLRLWESQGSDGAGVTRFNESIDEALTGAVNSFTKTTEQFRDQSLGILSHDLRNPLSAIIMGSTLLVGTDGLDDKSVRIAARMVNSANRMNRMIDALLDLTRTRSGDMIPVTRAPMDLEPLCRQVIAELEGVARVGKLRFTAQGISTATGTTIVWLRCSRTWWATPSSMARRTTRSCSWRAMKATPSASPFTMGDRRSRSAR